MTRSMARWTLAGCMALAALSAVTVLDVGSTTAEAAPDASPFAGNWSGTWSIPERPFDGTFDWTISNAGRIEGTVHNFTTGLTGSLAGHVGADGDLQFTSMAPSDTPSGGSNGLPFQGTAVIDDGELVVSATCTGSISFALFATLESD
jgi:hypothetical protein